MGKKTRYVVADPPEVRRASDWDPTFQELREDLPGTTVRLVVENLSAPSNLANRLKNRYEGFAVFTAKGEVYACYDGLTEDDRKAMTPDDLNALRAKLRGES